MEIKRTIPTIRNDARNLAKELLQLEGAAETIKDVVKLLKRLELMPMSFILGRIPGHTITERAARVGISRQTYYYWLQGRSRPSPAQAEKLAEITGVPVADIRITL